MQINWNRKTNSSQLPDDWIVLDFPKTISNRRVKVGKVNKQDYLSLGAYPIIDQSQDYVTGYSDDKTLVYQDDLPVVIFGDHTRIFKYIDFPFICGADGTKVLVPDRDKVNPNYLYQSLENLDIPNKGYNRHYKLLKEQLLPIPDKDVQGRITDYIYAIEEKLQAEINNKNSLIILNNSLLHHLMTGKMRVQLD